MSITLYSLHNQTGITGIVSLKVAWVAKVAQAPVFYAICHLDIIYINGKDSGSNRICAAIVNLRVEAI